MAPIETLPVNTLDTHADGPPTHDYYKRAVYRAAPRRFHVEILPATKMGGSYSYGLRINPIFSDSASIKSTIATAEYEIWRRWEDCLWFQDMLELQYGGYAREKRQRLAAGKGVKKNGLYHHDRAASFESLPPGPDPKSVSKNIHDYLPKLTKRGTLFRPSQSTIDQRQQEFSALIEAFFQPDVPTLISDLREDRAIRDFFGYWRRDHDLTLKRNGKKARSTQLGGNSFSLYFSASNISLSLPNSYPDVPSSIPPSPVPKSAALPSAGRRRPHTAESNSSISLSDVEAPFRLRKPPSSAPARMGAFSDGASSDDERRTAKRKGSSSSSNWSSSSSIAAGASLPGPSSGGSSSAGPSGLPLPAALPGTSPVRRRVGPRGTPKSPSPRKEAFNVAEDFPLFLSSSTRDVGLPSRPVQPPTSRSGQPAGLEALPEDHELGAASTVSASEDDALPPPTPRSTVNANADRTNRNCIVFAELLDGDDKEYSSDGDVLEPDMRRISLSAAADCGLLTAATSSSSRPSSGVLSNLSLQSRRSSWRTSASIKVPRSRPSSAGSTTSKIDMDVPGLEHYPISLSDSGRRKMSDQADLALQPRSTSPPLSPSSGAGLRRSLSGGSRRPRSLSNPQHLPVAEEEVWSDLGEEFIDTYFGGPEPFFTPEDLLPKSVEEPAAPDDPRVPDSPQLHPIPERDMRRQEICVSMTPEQLPRPFQNRPSGQFHLPWNSSLSTLPLPETPTSPSFMLPPSPKVGDDILVVKAALDDAIVVFRTRRDTSLADVRQRIYDKFARQEGIPLSSEFTLAYVPPITSVKGDRPRASTVSAASSDWARQVAITSAEQWEVAVASCGTKVVLRITQPQPSFDL
ncbi:hypothetical protein BV25DRAFT_1819625 [Artomyces pyxidatus]|uniref:Uncharacterized protein n=1 Tax=Artomyces pyxidatus TaxID=48021 RepID=A0ACB8TFU4_9AGAM|nr:hypothetical protein BV25DRAFT_1819625 [Artomyces pyxidatus]